MSIPASPVSWWMESWWSRDKFCGLKQAVLSHIGNWWKVDEVVQMPVAMFFLGFISDVPSSAGVSHTINLTCSLCLGNMKWCSLGMFAQKQMVWGLRDSLKLFTSCFELPSEETQIMTNIFLYMTYFSFPLVMLYINCAFFLVLVSCSFIS